jgi:hypothetical protein
MESLPETRDLIRRWGLWSVMLDQPGPVWAFLEEAHSSPPPSPLSSIGSLDRGSRNVAERLLTLGRGSSSDLFQTEEGQEAADSLLRSGLAAKDAWGHHMFPFDDSRFGRSRRKKDHGGPKGFRQRRWLARCAHALGLFTMEDLLRYSPALDDGCKVRAILNEMSKGPLERKLYYDSGPVIVYGLPEAFRTYRPRGPFPVGNGTNLTVISPRDRMARVLMDDVRAIIARRGGFLIMEDTRCLSAVNVLGRSIPPKGIWGGAGERTHTADSLILGKVWMDLRLKRSEHLRDVKRAFSEHGFRAMTRDEGKEMEELYRDAGPEDHVPYQNRSSGK